MTRFGAVWPAEKFKSDAVGLVVPFGNSVKKPCGPVWLVAVTLMTTAVGGVPEPIPGTPPVSLTAIEIVLFGPILPLTPPVPLRESTIRIGDSVTKFAPDAVASV